MPKETKHTSLIQRSDASVIERENPTEGFRGQNEVQSAYEQVGYSPNREARSWYKDIYEFYQKNEC